jgi:flagellar protein FliO/FliZ
LLSSILGTDGSPLLSYLIVFLIMVVLLSLFAFGAKRFARGRLTLGGNGGTSRSRQPRLGIVDIYELDRQRQLILLRRDNIEHLLLVGGPNDVVVERNIVRAGTARVSAELADRSEPEADAPLPLPAGTEPAPLPPPFPEPELPRPSAPEPERVATFAAGPRPDGPMPDIGPEPARPASRLNASRRVEPPSLRAARQAPPPLEVPPASEAAPFVAPVPPVVPMPEPVLSPEPAPAPAGTRGAEPRNVDAAILNDMARQLEEALRRPSSAVAPARPAAPAVSPPPEPVAVPPLPEPAPPEPAPPPPPPPEPEPEPEPLPPPPPEPPPPPPPEPEPAPPPPPEPEPVPEPPPPPPPPEEPTPASKPASVQNPFSVEEIEAEFARLLGRPLDKR